MSTLNLNLTDSEGRKYGYVDYAWSNQSSCKFRVKITELNVDTVNLKTKFRVELYAFREDGYDTYSVSSQNVVSLRLTSHNGSDFNGQTYTANPSNLHVSSSTKNTVLLTHDYTAAHDSNGKLSIGLTAYINMYYGGYKTGTTVTTCSSFTAIDVSKNSSFTINSSTVYVNGTNTISGTITRGRWSGVAMSSHKITVTVGEKTTSKTVSITSDNATNYSVTIPKTFLNQTVFKSSRYYNGTITISAIDSNGTEHSAGSKTVTFYVPNYIISDDDVVDAINNSLQLVYTNPSLTATSDWYGKIIQNITKLKVTVNCSDILDIINYASIKKIEFHVGSSTISVTSPSSGNTYVLTSNVISSTNTSATDWYVTITDSRGVSGSSKILNAGSVIKYSPPKITSLIATRCTSDGTITESGKYVKLTVEATCSTYEDKSIDNNATLYYSVMKKQDTSFSEYQLLTDDTIIEVGEFSAVINVKIQDTLSSTESSINITASSNMKPLLDFIKGGKGAAIGKVAEEEDVLDLSAYSKTKIKKILEIYDEDSLYSELHVGLNSITSSVPIRSVFRMSTLNLVEINETSSIYDVSIGAGTTGLAPNSKTATLNLGVGCNTTWLLGTSLKRNFSNNTGTGSTMVWDSQTNQILVSSSAAKYKTDIKYIENTDEYHDIFEKIKPISYRYKTSEDENDTNIGFLADDIAEINPKLALYSEEGEVENYRDRDMFALLFMEVQRQNKIIKELQEEINELKS